MKKATSFYRIVFIFLFFVVNTISLNAYSVPPNVQETSQKVTDTDTDRGSYISLDLVPLSKKLGTQLYQCYLKYKLNWENIDGAEKLKTAFNFLITRCSYATSVPMSAMCTGEVMGYLNGDLNEDLNHIDEFFIHALVEQLHEKQREIAEGSQVDLLRAKIVRLIRVSIDKAIRDKAKIKEKEIVRVIQNAIDELTEDDIASIVKEVLTEDDIANIVKDELTDDDIVSMVKEQLTEDDIASIVKDKLTEDDIASIVKKELPQAKEDEAKFRAFLQKIRKERQNENKQAS
ncbi:MAG: hypothetical protein PUP46_02335 [Endozoicomonas sp. (ex Botrylloides leachii)]|nr:hypothetical protein [Endozoicomonas sp. (ex Botrylloides leachii)]